MLDESLAVSTWNLCHQYFSLVNFEYCKTFFCIRYKRLRPPIEMHSILCYTCCVFFVYLPQIDASDILQRICEKEKESESCIVVNHGGQGGVESGLVFFEIVSVNQ